VPDPSPTRWGTQHLQRACRGHVGYSKLVMRKVTMMMRTMIIKKMMMTLMKMKNMMVMTLMRMTMIKYDKNENE
jgi:hypothetical protein